MTEYCILIADDDEDDFFVLQSAFEETQTPVIIDRAKSGIEVMEFLYTKVKQNKNFPDVVILDINMPMMDGITVLDLMRSTPLFKSIPVIMYSTSGTAEERCMAAGANGYATKGDSLTKVASFTKEVIYYLKKLKTNPACLFKNGKSTIDK